MVWNKQPGKNSNQPPDLDEALKKLHAKIKSKLSGKAKSPKAGATTTPPTLSSINGGYVAGLLILGILILWALSGIFIVDPAEQAVILRFGKYQETVGPGPHWIPRFISSKVVKNVENVMDYSYAAQMLTQDENLVSVSLVVQYRIGDLEAYLFNVADPIESLEQATSSALRQVVGNTTLDRIITEGREAWGNRVQNTLVNILKSYNTGIVIINVSPQPARAPESVQDAFDDAIKAQEDEKRFKEQARAYEASVLPIAEGHAKRILAQAKAYAEQVRLKANGETALYLALLPQYLSAPQVLSERLYFDTLQEIFKKTTKIIVDSKTNNLLYLPIEKILTNKKSVKTKKEQVAPSNSEEDTQSEVIRLSLRPTERMRR